MTKYIKFNKTKSFTFDFPKNKAHKNYKLFYLLKKATPTAPGPI